MDRCIVLLAAGAMSGVLAGCVPAVTPEAARVQVSHDAPRGCESLGVIEREVTVPPDSRSSDRLFVALQNAAAERGADYLYLRDAHNADGTDRVGDLALRTLFGSVLAAAAQGSRSAEAIAYRCGSPAERLERLQAELRDTPSQVTGFELGSSMEKAHSDCTSRGGTWTQGASGVVCDLSEGTFARLSPCGALMCTLEVVESHPIDDDATWAEALESGRVTLEEEFGTATEQPTLPFACRDRLLDCTAHGQVDLLNRWRWPDGSFVEYRVTTVGGHPATKKVYHREVPR